MDVQTACQFLILVHCAIRFFAMVNFDFNGRQAVDPPGFPGFCATIVVTIGGLAAFYLAGAFDRLIE